MELVSFLFFFFFCLLRFGFQNHVISAGFVRIEIFFLRLKEQKIWNRLILRNAIVCWTLVSLSLSLRLELQQWCNLLILNVILDRDTCIFLLYLFFLWFLFPRHADTWTIKWVNYWSFGHKNITMWM